MDAREIVQRAPPAASAGMDYSEEMLAEVDEPPDELRPSPTKLRFTPAKTQPRWQRRESLLTRQLHSETEHTDDDQSRTDRATSIVSTWSTQSATSMTELTSDDGYSVPSPAISPPLLPTQTTAPLPQQVKPLEQKVKIVGHDDIIAPPAPSTASEKIVEANLGRKRCISFACRGKQEEKPAPPPVPAPAKTETAAPPERKCMLKFACPTRAGAEAKTAEQKPSPKRPVSPPPPMRRASSRTKHRGSDSTVTHVSPKAVRKAPAPATTTAEQPASVPTRRYSIDSTEGSSSKEATRFHEFGTSEEEPEEWVQESTCHRNRLTVDDTLKKENMIRKTCEEAAEEVLEEEEEEEKEMEEEDAAALEMTPEDNDDDLDDESDEGFHSDDEGGFASSDSEREDDSDYEWWKPGGASTAATSVEHLDRLAIVNSQHVEPGTSAHSDSSGHVSPHSSTVRKGTSKKNKSKSIAIDRRGSIDLPDSTDFVCGTLDEDRPIEQAYIERKKEKDAAKHPLRPQDIDPSFPTSDPEMDEEDDDDVDEFGGSEEDDDMVQGTMEEVHDISGLRSLSPHRRGRHHANPSPPPSGRVHHSPPPKRAVARSPAPVKRAKSPAPVKRAKSPAPRKLFGNSPPQRARSPAPFKRMTSPPNSPTERSTSRSTARYGLAASRPQLTHTASLPRNGPIALSRLAHWGSDEEENDDTETGTCNEVPKRSAIDIVKGVEFKRQLRKRKLHQKMCAKAALKGDKPHKVKPGKGAERMREVGLQLQQYHGKAEHILSL